MANHGLNRHSKRLALSPLVPVSRKGLRYVQDPSSGRHKRAQSMPLILLLREILHVVRDKREAKQILSAGKVMLDGRPAKDPAIPVGLMDIVSIPEMKVAYQIVVAHGHFFPSPVPVETSTKLCKIIGKKIIGGGKIHLALHDGRSYMIEREEDRFSVGDTMKISFPKQTLSGFLKLEKGAKCYVYAGKHAGELGVLQSVLERAGSAPADVSLKETGGKEILTRKDYVLAVDEHFALPKPVAKK